MSNVKRSQEVHKAGSVGNREGTTESTPAASTMRATEPSNDTSMDFQFAYCSSAKVCSWRNRVWEASHAIWFSFKPVLLKEVKEQGEIVLR